MLILQRLVAHHSDRGITRIFKIREAPVKDRALDGRT
jgi:hypothetical protein